MHLWGYRYDRVLPAVHAYGFFWRYRVIKDIAQITSYRDAIGAPCIRAQTHRSVNEKEKSALPERDHPVLCSKALSTPV